MSIWLVHRILDGYILCAFTREDKARVYVDDLNAALDAIGESAKYALTSTFLNI